MWKRAGDAVWATTLVGLLGFLTAAVLVAFTPVGFPVVVAAVAAAAVWMLAGLYVIGFDDHDIKENAS